MGDSFLLAERGLPDPTRARLQARPKLVKYWPTWKANTQLVQRKAPNHKPFSRPERERAENSRAAEHRFRRVRAFPLVPEQVWILRFLQRGDRGRARYRPRGLCERGDCRARSTTRAPRRAETHVDLHRGRHPVTLGRRGD